MRVIQGPTAPDLRPDPDGRTRWQRPATRWLTSGIVGGSWLLALWALSESCVNFGGGPCRSEVDLPEPLMVMVLLWAPMGLLVVPGVVGLALLITVMQARRRSGTLRRT